MKNNDEILIGACTVYMYEFTGTEIPEHATIETEEHDVGHCSSGFTVNYKPTKYDVKNQYGQIVKSAITEEEISAKTGEGITGFLQSIEAVLRERKVEIEALYPYKEAGKIQKIRKYGELQEEEYREDGLYLEGIVKTEDLHCFEGYLC